MQNWPFLDQNNGLTPLEKCQFLTIWSSCFYSLEKHFLVLEYRKRHFPGLYCLKKKKLGKMAIFGPKAWVNPFWKMSIFRLFETFSFYSLERHFFVVEYRKRHYPGLYCLKKKVGKMAIFGRKPWVNPFRKMSIFRLLEPSYFYSLERNFLVLEYRKYHFPGLYWLKKKVEKWPFLNQNHGLTPLEKYQFSDFLNLLFL